MSATEWAVGMRVTSARLNSNMIRRFVATGSGLLAAGSTNVVVPGLEITITTLADNVDWLVNATIDFDSVTSGSTTLARANLRINTVQQSNETNVQYGSANANNRDTHPGLWAGTLATAGVYTFDITGNTPSGGITIAQFASRMTVLTIGHVSP